MTAETSGFTKVIILGAGAIGSYYGSMLSKKTDVLLIDRRGRVDAVSSLGLEVTGAVEETFDLDASTELSGIPEGSLVARAVSTLEGSPINDFHSTNTKKQCLAYGFVDKEVPECAVF